jgi:hypothetical protein
MTATTKSGSGMKARAAWTAVLLAMSIASAFATVRITDDPGGQIGTYLAKFHALRLSGERVEIDGVCASACTMLLGVIPRDRICVTPRAVLQFHAAWDPTASGEQVVNGEGSRILLANYPSDIRRWIGQHGGLRTEIITLSGATLAAMFPRCH